MLGIPLEAEIMLQERRPIKAQRWGGAELYSGGDHKYQGTGEQEQLNTLLADYCVD